MIALLFFLCLSACQMNDQKPNIIFIMSDDHASQAISSYGSIINQTPNIDRIASEGIRFENVFCTNSICAPSRAVILTGKHSFRNGVIDNRMAFDGSQQTLPKLLQKAGYQTALVGKWHLKSDPTGFDYWNILPGQGEYYNPDLIEMGSKKRYTGYVTDIITDLALHWLENRKPEKPFFLMYNHKAPHRNWMPGPDHLTKYDDIDIPIPDNFFDDYRTRSAAAYNQEMEIGRHMFKAYDLKLPVDPADTTDFKFWTGVYARFNERQRQEWDRAYGPKNKNFLADTPQGDALKKYYYQRYIKDYLRSIASVDDNVGRLLDYLDQNDLTENTVVIYTSDQGFYLGEHGWFDKRFIYEESLRMPLLIRYPDQIEPGLVNIDMIQNLDFAPTILELADVDVPLDMQGQSFMPFLFSEIIDNWRTAIYYHYYEYPGWHMVYKHYGIRTERYKLIHFYQPQDAWAVYDLNRDPFEMNNLYNEPVFQGQIRELKEQLDDLMVAYGDTLFMRN
jgi:arylsulfatase A-like enzyme